MASSRPLRGLWSYTDASGAERRSIEARAKRALRLDMCRWGGDAGHGLEKLRRFDHAAPIAFDAR